MGWARIWLEHRDPVRAAEQLAAGDVLRVEGSDVAELVVALRDRGLDAVLDGGWLDVIDPADLLREEGDAAPTQDGRKPPSRMPGTVEDLVTFDRRRPPARSAGPVQPPAAPPVARPSKS